MKLQVVPARAGALWVRQGMRTFAKQPLIMGGLFFMFIITISLPTIVPVLGFLVALGLVPATTVGFMAGASEIEAGRLPKPLVLFTALRQGPLQTRRMVTLGVVYAAAVMAVMGISYLIDGGDFVRLYMGHASLTPEMAANPRFRLAMWTTLALYIPISVAFWFAPPLVHWHAIPPAQSLFFSVVAVWRNIRAFLVYGALWTVFSALGSAVLLVVMAISGSSALASVSFVVFGLVLAAMFFSSLWFTFRDCFPADDAPAA